ncbi:MAG TPA: right-handed parallel beta-helix repeat-containing protein [Caulobacteraceae bacterium]|jgi:parallel beta-helix repeat protein|nr:right-handed parallel beta-helix repeat-containing protein [Caulobacteraceae bacterium]
MRVSLSVGLIGLGLVCAADAPARTIATSEDLERALHKAQPGEVLALSPGVYDELRINGFHGTVTITSADPKRPAQIHRLTIRDSSGVTLQGVELVAPLADPAVGWRQPFVVAGSSHITLKNLDVHSVAGSTLATENGGLIVRESDHILIADSDFHDLHAAIQHGNIDHLEIRGNQLRHLRDDGIRGGGSSNVVIADNHCSSQHPDLEDQDHPDCIQFWTTNTTQPAHDITVENNTYDRGSGMPIQGIFFNDEAGHPYERVTIRGNRLHGASWNGIYVHDASDVVLENNEVCDRPDRESWMTLINVHGATLRDNRAGKYQLPGSTQVKEVGNDIVHCME